MGFEGKLRNNLHRLKTTCKYSSPNLISLALQSNLGDKNRKMRAMSIGKKQQGGNLGNQIAIKTGVGLLGAWMLIYGFFLTFTPAHAKSAEKLNILIIFSWHKDLPWQMEIEKGFNTHYKEIPSKPNLFIEYMDAGRFKGQNQIEIFKTYLHEKYADYAIDSVIFDGPTAARLLVSYPELFKDSKKAALTPGALDDALSSVKSTLIPVNTDYQRSVNALLKISQGKTIYLVGGTTKNSKERVQWVYDIISKNHPSQKVVRLTDLAMETLLDKLSQLDPKKSIIFFLLFFRDANGVRYVPYEAVKQISQRANAPVYTMWTSLMGSGIVGGYLLSGEMLGQTVADMMSRPEGTMSVDTASLMEHSHAFYYDWRQLKRWDISEKSLPAGSNILYKELTFYELYYKELIFGSLTLVIVISFFWIVRLRQEIDRRLMVEDQLKNQNEMLEELAVTDRLTGLFNRIKLDQSLQDEVKRFERYKKPFSIMIMDIDHFKKINDTYGHQAGDEVLKKFATILMENLRNVDIIGRWGGEEFLIICPETSLVFAAQVAEKLREKIESCRFHQDIRVTASIGISEILADERETDLIQRADNALYLAKESGRNRIECG